MAVLFWQGSFLEYQWEKKIVLELGNRQYNLFSPRQCSLTPFVKEIPGLVHFPSNSTSTKTTGTILQDCNGDSRRKMWFLLSEFPPVSYQSQILYGEETTQRGPNTSTEGDRSGQKVFPGCRKDSLLVPKALAVPSLLWTTPSLLWDPVSQLKWGFHCFKGCSPMPELRET